MLGIKKRLKNSYEFSIKKSVESYDVLDKSKERVSMRTIETENLKLIYFNEDNDEWVEVTEFFNGEWSEPYIMDLDEVLINFGICF